MRTRLIKRILSRYSDQSGSGGRRTKYGHRLNWRPDLPDFRDRFYLSTITAATASDLEPQMPPVVNQLDIGSCTGNGSAGAWDFLQLKELKQPGVEQPQEFDPKDFHPASRLFIYYHEREIEGTVNEDAGAAIRTAIKALSTVGVCREELWGYARPNLFIRPNAQAMEEASRHKISIYERVGTLDDIRRSLTEGFPVVFGFMVFESFESIGPNGLMPFPGANERDLGGHCVLAVGHDDSRKVIKCRNSWGPGWGRRGYFDMPYDFIRDPRFADDFWRFKL